MQVSNINSLNFGLTIQPTTFRTKRQKHFLHECIDKYDNPLLWLDCNLRTSGVGDMLITETKDGNTAILINFHNCNKKPVKKLQKVFNLKSENFKNIKEQLKELIEQGKLYQSIVFAHYHKEPKEIHKMLEIADYS